MIAWKVVTMDRVSCVIRGKFSRHYLKGVRVTPLDSRFPMLAFEKVQQARDFIRKRDQGNCEQVLRCRVRVSRIKGFQCLRISIGYHIILEDLLRHDLNSYDPIAIWPGTVLCNAVTALE